MLERLQERRNRRAEGEGGFTLIELLVVIIILGILAAVVVFAVGGVGDKGARSSCVIDTRTIRTAQEAYSARPGGNGDYANSTAALVPTFLSEASKLHTTEANNTGTTKTFTIKVLDPKCGNVGALVGTDGLAGAETAPADPKNPQNV